MNEWLDRAVSLGGILLALSVAALLIRSLLKKDDHAASHLHLVAFCVQCGWEGRVPKTRLTCQRCGSTHLNVVAT